MVVLLGGSGKRSGRKKNGKPATTKKGWFYPEVTHFVGREEKNHLLFPKRGRGGGLGACADSGCLLRKETVSRGRGEMACFLLPEKDRREGGPTPK